jgi:hypothetical protein
MPTYRNTTAVPLYAGGATFKPGVETATFNIIDNNTDLVKVSDAPFFNPVREIEDVEFTEAGQQTVDVDSTKPGQLQIFNIQECDLKIYFNSVENLPPLSLTEGNRFTSNINQSINKVILESNGAGKCTVLVKIKTSEVV